MQVKKPRVLIVSPHREVVQISRMPKALSEAGFEVAALCSERSFLANTRYLDAKFYCPINTWWMIAKFGSVVRSWRPDFIIPGEGWSRSFLECLTSSIFTRLQVISGVEVQRVLTRSLGHPECFGKIGNKHELLNLAMQVGVRTPSNSSFETLDHAFAIADQYGYPVVVKSQLQTGGTGVLICNNRTELAAAYDQLRRMRPVHSMKRSVRDALSRVLCIPTVNSDAQLSLERFIKGRPALHNFVALRGEKLAGITAWNEQPYKRPTGPSCIIRTFEHDEINAIASTMIARMGFSGFGCFDFVVEDGTSDAYLIECNPYPTNIAHLGKVVGSDLCAALYARLTGTMQLESCGKSLEQVVVLFPQELRRNPQSPHVQSQFHDVPYDDPILREMMLRHFGLSLDHVNVASKSMAET